MLTVATMSHLTAPIAIREHVAIAPDALEAATARAQTALGPSAILATCNRFEVYVAGRREPDRLVEFIGTETGTEVMSVRRHFRVHHDADAIRHLYRVAAGVESLVLGEYEIMGQLRGAFSLAAGAGMEDAVLVRALHGAIRAGRRARRETAIGHRALSVSSIAARLARETHPRLAEARVLVLGAGEAARLAAEALVDQGVGDLTVINRTLRRAEVLAADLQGRAVPFERLAEEIVANDIVVAASGAPGTLIDLELMQAVVRRREGSPLLAIDIGMPRDIDARVAMLPSVTYYDMEGLQEIAAQNAQARSRELPSVEAILDEEIAEFLAWFRHLRTRPTIASLNQRAEEIRIAAVEKSLRKLNADAEMCREVDALTRALVKRLLHDPITTLRNRGEREQQYVEAVRTLFKLDDEPSIPVYGGIGTEADGPSAAAHG